MLENPLVRRPHLLADHSISTESLVIGDWPLSIFPESELRDFLNEYL